MASNEEIIQKVNPDNSPSLWSDAMVSECMDAARKDEAMAFAEWVSKSFWHYNINTLSWYNTQLGHRRVISSELYTIFKQQNS